MKFKLFRIYFNIMIKIINVNQACLIQAVYKNAGLINHTLKQVQKQNTRTGWILFEDNNNMITILLEIESYVLLQEKSIT